MIMPRVLKITGYGRYIDLNILVINIKSININNFFKWSKCYN